MEIALNDTKMTKFKKTSKTCQTFDFRIEEQQHLFPHAFRSLLCIWFVAVAFGSEEKVF